jgi:hypothetical protein
MLGKIKNPGGSIPWRGDHNGVSVRFDIPAGAVLEVVDAEELGYKTYICQITIDGVKYTNVKIPKAFVDGDERWFDFIPANQAGGKSRRRGSRKMSGARFSTKRRRTTK